MLSKLLVGQEISAYTKDDHVFEGVIVENSNGKKVALNEDGKWQLLENLKKIKQIGRRLNEENEQAVDNIINKLSPQKVYDKEPEFENLAKQIADAAGFSPSDANRNDIEKYAQEKLIGIKTGIDAEKSGNQAAVEKAKDSLKKIEKTPEEMLENPTLEESQYIKNKNMLREYNNNKTRRQRLGEDAMYDFDEDDFDASIDDDSFYFEDGYDDFGSEDEFTYDASEDLLYDDDFEETPIDDGDYSEIDSLVDTEFEDALDDYEAQGGDYSDEAMLESLASVFGGDAKKALKETKSIPDAVCHLADQVKALRKAELKK